MGANLCCLRHSSSSIADHHDDHDDHQEPKELINQTLKSSSTTTSTTTTTTTTSCLWIVGLIRRPGCLRITDHDNDDKKTTTALFIADTHAEEKISEKKKLTTLKDWIMDSPEMNNNHFNSDTKSNLEHCHESGELYVSTHLSSRKIHPSSSSSSSSKSLPSSSNSSSARSSLAASRIIDSIILEPVVKSRGTSCSNLMGKSKSERFTKKVSFKEENNIIAFYSPEL